MDDLDRKNLSFLLNASRDELQTWYDSASESDRNYASEILKRYKSELDLKKILYFDPEISSISESVEILNKFKLGKK